MTSVSGGGFSFSCVHASGTWSWTVVVNNVRVLGATHDVSNVMTPWGRLYDVAVDIPGDVITAMSESIATVKQQFAPVLSLVSPIPPVFNVIVAEGDPDAQIGSATFRNSGAFGSLLDLTATPSVPWLASSPSAVNGLPQNGQASFSGTVLTASLLSSGSPYSGSINVMDKRGGTSIPVVVTVVVLPRPTISVSPSSVILTYIILTGTPGAPQTLRVTNSGPPLSSLSFSVAKVQDTSPWLAYSVPAHSPLPAGSYVDVGLSIISSGVPMCAGTYSDTLRVSSLNASNDHVDVPISLIVS